TLIDPVAQVFHAGDVLGKYAIRRQIGRGGSGIVFQATDLTLKRAVALKVLSPPQAEDRQALRRFVREAQGSARLQHDNVVAIYEIDKQSDYVFIAMELARGGSAKDLVAKRGGLPWKAATRVVADACRGLAAAHAVALV